MLVVLGAGWRVGVAARTPVPAEDGANYLWMAEQLARGAPCATLDAVFPPLNSMVCAVGVALLPWLEPFRAAQLVLAVVGALAAVPLARLVERVAPGGGWAAAWLMVTAPLPIRCAAEIYSEPAYLLCASMALHAWVRGASGAAGAWLGAASWARPEALVLAGALALAAPRKAWRMLWPVAVAAAVLSAARALCGHGPDPMPKAGFVWERTIGVAPGIGDMVAAFGRHALQMPWLWVEAFAISGVLAVLGVWRGALAHRRAFLAAAVLGCALICAFLPRRRFLVTWLPVVLPLAVAGLGALPARCRSFVLAAAVLLNVALSVRVIDADRVAERRVGAWLATQCAPGERITGDMTRVLYFAGERPLPPKPFTAEQLADRAHAVRARFVVLGARRPTTPEARRLLGDYRPLRLPPELAELAHRRGILTLHR